MASCHALHRSYDKSANGAVQVGELPDSTHIRGRVAWYVYAGAYRDLADKGWDTLMRKVPSSGLKPRGAPGDVYICDPGEHKGEREAKMLTILWAPIE